MKALFPLALLAALAACDGPQEVTQPLNAAPQLEPSASPPSTSAARPPAPETGEAAGAGRTDRFIVCPGNPRCPKDGRAQPP